MVDGWNGARDRRPRCASARRAAEPHLDAEGDDVIEPVRVRVFAALVGHAHKAREPLALVLLHDLRVLLHVRDEAARDLLVALTVGARLGRLEDRLHVTTALVVGHVEAVPLAVREPRVGHRVAQLDEPQP